MIRDNTFLLLGIMMALTIGLGVSALIQDIRNPCARYEQSIVLVQIGNQQHPMVQNICVEREGE